MSCLLHLLCESAMPNIKIQKTGVEIYLLCQGFSASDLGVRRIGSQGKNLWHKISELENDRSGIFSVPMTAVHSRKDLTFKNPL